jgi:hypothetical protein
MTAGCVVDQPTPIIELALCLDTSNSMDGLIDAAKTKLWTIVNELATAQPTPKLRVALLSYGNNGYLEETGWVRVESTFTEDLDMISEKLFGLTTWGGTEYVGRVMHTADTQLDWCANPNAMRMLVVAGNETADQDQQYRSANVAQALSTRNIVVNAIYCETPGTPVAETWQSVAALGKGYYAAIDQQKGTLYITTPFDEELAKLSGTLNTTYIPYGQRGQWHCQNQMMQDDNAALMNTATASQRAVSKASAMYQNDHWDLVDACGQKDFDLSAVKTEDLPENMHSMTPGERAAYIEGKRAARAEIQAAIQTLGQQREAWRVQYLKDNDMSEESAFDTALRKAIRTQAIAHGLAFTAEITTTVTTTVHEARNTEGQ